jgi:hypothetical protein
MISAMKKPAIRGIFREPRDFCSILDYSDSPAGEESLSSGLIEF